MTAERLFLDTAVLALAVGGERPLREACRTLLERAARGEAEIHVSVEALQELLFHRMRRGSRPDAVALVRDVRELCHVHPFEDSVLLRTLDLAATTSLGGRDAVHAATALVAGFEEIVTPDHDFDAVPGLRRRDPV
ncbi:VapC toxin family PIN domain ribonuclease [Serinibacter arcticus]|uniref:Ribonuclease VapC n=1 Tax=Serinibacter arcticus TaxID=1655435 RepID=A0A2U1ZW98_9MICO|nr:type II toxin-antitoxin system VapC family toxin [Serinibacter arcticus]PWD51244.1 VapC toxin family PIN domain ribonuclease [Serinibacter arcticus]